MSLLLRLHEVTITNREEWGKWNCSLCNKSTKVRQMSWSTEWTHAQSSGKVSSEHLWAPRVLPCHKLSSWYWVTHTHQLFHWFGWNWIISYGGNVFCFSLWWTHELNSSTSELLMEQTLCGVSRSQIGLHVVGTIGSVPAERTTGVNRNMLKSGCWFAAMLRYNHT